MYIEIILMGFGVAVAIIALLSSKFVRTVCREAISHPRNRCEIQVRGEKISVKRGIAEGKLEG